MSQLPVSEKPAVSVSGREPLPVVVDRMQRHRRQSRRLQEAWRRALHPGGTTPRASR